MLKQLLINVPIKTSTDLKPQQRACSKAGDTAKVKSWETGRQIRTLGRCSFREGNEDERKRIHQDTQPVEEEEALQM